jgi:tetratricopeptide (TPR) repeat protein
VSGSAEALRARARGAIELKRYEQAVEEAGRAIAADPTSSDGHGLLSQAQHGMRRYEQALKTAEAALALAPEDEWLHRLRSIALLDLGRPREALAAVDEALRLEPASATAHGLRARCLIKMANYVPARQALKRAIEIAPETAWLHRVRGDLELDDHHDLAAERAYREALRCSPHDAVAFNNLGVALQRQGRAQDAALAFKSAVLLDPTLQVAKQNTHSQVKSMTGPVAAGVGIGGAALAKACLMASPSVARSSSDGDGTTFLVFLVVAALVVLVVALAVRSVKRSHAEQKIKDLDPQLWDMYEKLERDKRDGRL